MAPPIVFAVIQQLYCLIWRGVTEYAKYGLGPEARWSTHVTYLFPLDLSLLLWRAAKG